MAIESTFSAQPRNHAFSNCMTDLASAVYLRRHSAAAASDFISSSASAWNQGRTLVHLSAQCKRFWWDKEYLGGVYGLFEAGVEGVFRRLGDVLSV